MAEFKLSKLDEYREHYQLEAKTAKGGFPGSFWETYSAFAITNACVHADFYGRQGIVIQKSEDGYRLSNPGSIRISISDAIEGGISDPRNGIMLKIFSLVDFGERAGSGLSGIYKHWKMVYHTRAKIEETHKDGADRTVLTLSTGGNEPDVKAMLELYDDIIEASESSNKQKAQNEPQNKAIDPLHNPQEGHEPQNEPQKLFEVIRVNPKITKAKLSKMFGISPSTLKRWLKANHIIWVGHSKNGHWEILKQR